MNDGLGSANRGRSALVLLVLTPIVVVLLLNHSAISTETSYGARFVGVHPVVVSRSEAVVTIFIRNEGANAGFPTCQLKLFGPYPGVVADALAAIGHVINANGFTYVAHVRIQVYAELARSLLLNHPRSLPRVTCT
jgi:hypothetical protein